MCRCVRSDGRKYSLSLRRIMQKLGDDELKGLLSSFSCARDEDIQNFLHNRAIRFERFSKSRTYLITNCVEERLRNPQLTLDDFVIYGYISLGMKVFTAPETMSNRQRQQLDGFSAKLHGKQISNFPCYLIGQLARNSNVPKESISGSELLGFADQIIRWAVQLVGGRNILVECRNDKKLIQFYLDNGFSQISQLPDEDQSMVQLMRKIEFGGYTQ